MTLLDLAQAAVDRLGISPTWFQEQALWAAGASQRATTLPALVVVASTSLLVVVLWIMFIAWAAALIRRIWRGLREYAAETR